MLAAEHAKEITSPQKFCMFRSHWMADYEMLSAFRVVLCNDTMINNYITLWSKECLHKVPKHKNVTSNQNLKQ